MKVIPLLLFVSLIASSCNSPDCQATAKQKERSLSSSFENYWFEGLAEINTYTAKQARYGEVHPGKAVLIFVTEPFSKTKQVKLDNAQSVAEEEKVTVMKLNAMRKFNTGVYSYSVMTSTFTPLTWPVGSCIKLTTSAQEWCGHSFMQLNRTGVGYTGNLYSYFEKEGDHGIALSGGIFEDELFTQIRLAPKNLPTGKVNLIPQSQYLRFKHIEVKPYAATCTIDSAENSYQYSIEYNELKRKVTIWFQNAFPYQITKWEEQYLSGFGNSAKTITSTFTLDRSIRLDYWRKNTRADAFWRDSLGLYHFETVRDTL